MHFGDLLKKYMHDRRRTDQQLADLSGVPKFTIVGWREGRTKRPRNGADLLLVAEALTLTLDEGDALLVAAGHPSIRVQLETAERKEDQPALDRLAFWRNQPAFASPAHPAKPEQNRPPASFQAPPAVVNFTGRESLIDEVEQYLLEQNGRIASLVGMGGVGKTAIANRLAYQLRSHFPDGVFWVDLRHMVDREDASVERTLAAFLSAIIQTFAAGFEQVAELALLSAQLRNIMANNQLLLVVDNIESADQISYFLPPSDGASKLIVTTRRKLMSQADAQDFAVASLSETESLALFEKYVAKRRLALEPERAKTLCEFLGHLPLAIQIVASDLAETEDITLQEYLDLLLDERERLVEDLDQASRSVRATFELSYKRLSAELQPLFANLIIFKGLDFSSEAVIKTFDLSPIKAKRLLSHLYRVSLLEKGRPTLDSSGARYQFHPLLKQFAQEKLAQFSTLTPGYYDRAARYYIDLAFQQRYDRLDLLDYDWENCLEGVVWALMRQETDQVLRGLTGLTAIRLGVVGFLDSRTHWREAIDLLGDVLANLGDHFSLEDHALLRVKLGIFYLRFGRLDEAKTELEHGLGLLGDDELGTSFSNRLTALYGADSMARILLERADFEEVLTWSEQATQSFSTSAADPAERAEAGFSLIRHSEMLGRMRMYSEGVSVAEEGLKHIPVEPSGAMIVAHLALGSMYYHQSLLDPARAYWSAGLEMAQAVGDVRRTLSFSFNLALLSSNQGDFKTAIPIQFEAIEMFERMGDIPSTALNLSNVAEDLIFSGRLAEAEKALATALKFAEELGLNDVRMRVLVNYLQLELARSNAQAASNYLAEIEQMQGTLIFQESLDEILFLTAQLHLLEGSVERALTVLTPTIQADENQTLQQARSLHLLGECLLLTGNKSEAEKHLLGSMMLSEKNSYSHLLAEAGLTLGKQRAKMGAQAEAQALLNAAADYYAVQEINHRLVEIDGIINELG